jgi:hypothetical protein
VIAASLLLLRPASLIFCVVAINSPCWRRADPSV